MIPSSVIPTAAWSPEHRLRIFRKIGFARFAARPKAIFRLLKDNQLSFIEKTS